MLRTLEVARRLRTGGRLGAALVATTLLAAGCGGKGGGYSVEVTPGSLSFTAERHGPVPASQRLTATFDGEGLLVGYPAGTAAPSWLEVGEVSHGATTATLSARIVSTGLAAGVYTTTLRFVTGKADGSEYVLRDVPVRLEILAPAYELTGATTVTITQAASLADLVLPLTLRSGLDAAQGAACTWTLSSPVSWLTVTPTSGTLASDTTLQATLDAEALWAAPLTTLTADLDIQLGAGCTRAAYLPTTVSVQTRIQPKVSVAPVGFTVAGGTTSAEFTKQAAVVVDLGEAFASHGYWTATLSTLEQPWASISPWASTGSGPVTIELSTAALASLPAGHHVANLAIVPSDARLQTANAPITLDLTVPRPGPKEQQAVVAVLTAQATHIKQTLDQIEPEYQAYRESIHELDTVRQKKVENAKLARTVLMVWSRSHKSLARGVEVPPMFDLGGIIAASAGAAAKTLPVPLPF